MRAVVVGIDAGTTTAVAVFGLDRELLALRSKRGFSASGVIEFVRKVGKPLSIATDRARPPAAAKRLAAAFGCRLFIPDHDMSTAEKAAVARAFGPKSTHERDALAAGIFALKSMGGQFAKISSELRARGLEHLAESVLELIVTKRAKNISDAVEQLTVAEDWKERAMAAEAQLARLRNSYEILKLYAAKLEKKVARLEEQRALYTAESTRKTETARRAVLRERELRAKDMLIAHLQSELAKLQQIRHGQKAEQEAEKRALTAEGYAPLVPVSDFTREALAAANRDLGIAGEIVYIARYRRSTAAAKALIALAPKAVLFDEQPAEHTLFSQAGIAVVIGLRPQYHRFYAAIKRKELEKALLAAERSDFLRWLAKYRRR